MSDMKGVTFLVPEEDHEAYEIEAKHRSKVEARRVGINTIMREEYARGAQRLRNEQKQRAPLVREEQ